MVEQNKPRVEHFEFRNITERNPNVLGVDRLLTVTHGSVVTRLEITGHGFNDDLVTLSNVTVPTETYEKFKHLIMNGLL